METRLAIEIEGQPDDTTCGPTCLHALYRYYGEDVALSNVIGEVSQLESGGTLAVWLACHALRRGYQARIYTYNLQLFDPSWFRSPRPDLREKLRAQALHKTSARLQSATRGYEEYLALGGEVELEDLSAGLIRSYLLNGRPLLTGLSSTFLYRDIRDYGPRDEDDDVRGEPAGHFVVLCGYDRITREVLVADPFLKNPYSPSGMYTASVERVMGAILLGVLTYDANVMVVHPPNDARRAPALASDPGG